VPQPAPDVTQLLRDWSRGSQTAIEQLTPLVYQELRRLAEGYMRNERASHTLQPTALIHEAFLRLIDQGQPEWQSRSHFFQFAAHLLRQILVDHARATRAAKRGGGEIRVPLESAVIPAAERPPDLLALDEALNRLEQFDPRKSRALELRFFGGLKADEIAEALGISIATVGRETRLAEAWLYRELLDADERSCPPIPLEDESTQS
jgi:RNA polymerase sigma factor (TIGR02999 family)